MATLPTIHHGRGKLSPGHKGTRVVIRNLTLGSSILFAVALACCLPTPATRVVHAYSDNEIAAGATLFHERGCEHCHGADGRGGELGPDLSTIGRRWNKQQIEHQIHDGGGGMPAFGDALQQDEIKNLVEFLHAKRKVSKKSASHS